MARRGPVQRGTTNGRAILGSGRKIDTDDPKEAALKRKRSQPWHGQAWGFYDEIGEIWYAHNFVGNALRRARLNIAIPDPEGGAPTVIDRSEGNSAATAAYDALDRVQAPSGGQGALLASLGINLGVVGEGYLVGWHPDDPAVEEWDVFSPDQIISNGDDWHVRVSPDQPMDAAPKLTADDFIGRIWKRHPRWRDWSDSSMRPLIGPCDELLTLSKAIRGSAVSRLAGAGLLTVPQEISFGPTDPTEDEGDGGGQADQLTEDLLAVMMTPISDPSSAAAVVPMLLRGPAEFLKADVLRHITFDRPLDPEQAKQRQELIKRIANGLDLPAELLLGLSDANHWTGWLIDDQVFTAHIEPLLTLICWGLTSAYLRPALQQTEADGQNFIIWYDASAMVKHPNQAQDAQDAIDVMAIGYEPYRRAKGFSEADAPSDEDFARWQEVQAAKRGGGTPPVDGSEPPPASQETVTKAPPAKPTDLPSETEQEPIQASGRSRDRLPLGTELLDIDRALRTRMQVAADGAMGRSLELAGAKLRRKVGNNPTLARSINGIDNALVAPTLGAGVVSSLGFAATDLIGQPTFDALRPKWEGWTSAAQRRVAQLAQREGSDVDPDDYVALHQDDRDAGWIVLVAGLTSLAGRRLYDPTPDAPLLGEYDTVSSIPLGLIRGALSRAGGAKGAINDAGAMMVPDSHGRDTPAGGLATGPDAFGLLEDAGLTVTGWMWSTGGPDRPFLPHEDLDGAEFTGFDDDQLAADPGEFPFVSVYAPGDHDGCQCDLAPTIEASMVDMGDAIPQEEAA